MMGHFPKLRPLLILGVLGCGIASNALGVPVVWEIANGGNGHSYEAVASSVTWSQANAAAIARGGHLATIQNAAENQFVFDLINSNTYWKDFGSPDHFWGPWLGGRQPPGSAEPNGEWGWVTGEPFTYTNWQPSEPNNQTGFGEEDWLHYFSGPSGVRAPTWNDFFNTSTFPLNGFVVEYEGTEECDLVCLKRRYGPTLAEFVDFYDSASTPVSVAAIIMKDAPDPRFKATGIALFAIEALQTIAFGTVTQFLRDPPDMNYHEVFEPIIPTLNVEQLDILTPTQASTIRAALQLETEFAATAQALLISAERSSGAAADMALTAEMMQDAAAHKYIMRLGSLASDLAIAKMHVAEVFEELGLTQVVIDLESVEAFQSLLQDQGLPAEELAVISLFGDRIGDIQSMVDAIIALDGSTLAGMNLRDVALREAELYQSLADGIQRVPEPSSALLFVIMTIGFLTNQSRIGRIR